MSSYTYDGTGRLTGATIPGHTLTYGFTPHTGTDPCAGVSGVVGAAGSNGNRMRVSDTLAGTATPRVSAYCYDGADRLLATVVTGAFPGSTAISSSLSLAGGTPTLGYDTRGNTTKLGDTTLAYDGGDRLVSMISTGTNATSVTYTRDVLDRVVRRVEVTGGSTTTTRYGYTGSGDTPDAVLTDAKALTEQVIGLPGGVVCTDRVTGTDAWAHPNIHGDVIVTTNGTGTRQGPVVFYDPYGQPVDPATGRTGTTAADDAVPDTLTGNADNGWLGQHQRLYDHAGGLAIVDMGARAYSPVLGRFLEVDPVMGGVDNDYTYLLDPINMLDLDGQWCRALYIGTTCTKYVKDRYGRAVPAQYRFRQKARLQHNVSWGTLAYLIRRLPQNGGAGSSVTYQGVVKELRCNWFATCYPTGRQVSVRLVVDFKAVGGRTFGLVSAYCIGYTLCPNWINTRPRI